MTEGGSGRPVVPVMSEPSRIPWSPPAEPCPPGWSTSGASVGLPGVAMQVLWNRGLRSMEEVRGFLEPDLASLADPYLLSGMAPAVDRLDRALREHEQIYVFGDFDADGTAAAAMAIAVLRTLARRLGPGTGDPEHAVHSISPVRSEGFGLTERVVRDVNRNGGRLLLTVDCGTSARSAIALARELGVDVVVADHHAPGDELPPGAILVNPNIPGQRYPFRDLAAVGVVHRLLDALTRRQCGDGSILEEYLDLVAVGTVADVVPLVGENRVLVWHGLRRIREHPRPAWAALAGACGLDPIWISSIDIAYKLAPRLNAPGRLGSPARAVSLLLAETAQEARDMAVAIENDNRERRDRHEKILKEVQAELEASARAPGEPIVLGSAAWTPGVLGIVASRLVETYRVPVVLVSLQGEIARGSARTPPGHDLLAWLGGVQECLSQFGGHPQAAGVSMVPSRFTVFREALLRCEAPIRPETSAPRIDGALDPAACDLVLARALERLGPFGAGNAEPLFVGSCTCRRVRVERSRHLRFVAGTSENAPDCIGFGMGRGASSLRLNDCRVEILFRPVVNRHRGEERVQIKLRAHRPLADGAAASGSGNGCHHG